MHASCARNLVATQVSPEGGFACGAATPACSGKLLPPPGYKTGRTKAPFPGAALPFLLYLHPNGFYYTESINDIMGGSPIQTSRATEPLGPITPPQFKHAHILSCTYHYPFIYTTFKFTELYSPTAGITTCEYTSISPLYLPQYDICDT